MKPWEQVAREAAEVTGNGGIVIYPMYMPPFTSRTSPVMYAASSLGEEDDCGGDVAVETETAQRDHGLHFVFDFLRQRVGHGRFHETRATAFTVMLREATSTAIARVRPIKPALEAT